MLAFWIWFIGFYTNFSELLVGIMFVLGVSSVGCIILTIVRMSDDAEEEKIAESRKPAIVLAILMFLVGFIKCAIPSENRSYAILSAYVGEELARDPKFQEYAGKSLQLIGRKIDDLLKDAPAPKTHKEKTNPDINL